MKYFIMVFFLFSGAAFGQDPNRPSFAPLVGVTHYILDDQAFTGPTMGLRFLTREFSSSKFSVFGGATLRPNGFGYYRTEPFIYSDGQQPYRLQPPVYDGAIPSSRFAFGLAFVGFDWRTYLADGSIRPYVGIGAQIVSWSASNTWTGTIMPTADAGLDVHLSSGFSAFAESQYASGMPTLFGSRTSSLTNLFSFAVGVNFVPRW
jgi:hypothetical protein